MVNVDALTPELTAEITRRLPEALRQAQEVIRQLYEDAAVDRSLLDLPMTI